MPALEVKEARKEQVKGALAGLGVAGITIATVVGTAGSPTVDIRGVLFTESEYHQLRGVVVEKMDDHLADREQVNIAEKQLFDAIFNEAQRRCGSPRFTDVASAEDFYSQANQHVSNCSE